MIQFLAIMIHAFQLLFIDCNYPKAFVWWIGMHAVMFFFLFKEFYKQQYTKSSKKQQVKKTYYFKHFLYFPIVFSGVGASSLDNFLTNRGVGGANTEGCDRTNRGIQTIREANSSPTLPKPCAT